jgi:hypothetical protein
MLLLFQINFFIFVCFVSAVISFQHRLSPTYRKQYFSPSHLRADLSSSFFKFTNGLFGNKKKNDRIEVTESTDVAIIGAGISGLACANYMVKSNPNISFRIIEARDIAGGRVGSDYVDGFILDKGFQVFIDSYPESKQLLNYEQLQLQPFRPGAIIRIAGKFGLISDPFRRPQDILPSLLSPVGSLIDKLKVKQWAILLVNCLI